MIDQPIVQLLTALALGLLIGLERGWHERMMRAGGRVAGIRTFALVAVAGQVAGMLGTLLTPWIPVAALLGLSLLLALGYRLNSDEDRDFGTTTVIAALLTFLLGLLVSIGESTLAVGAAVIVTVLLHFKETLHGWIYGLNAEELRGILQLGLISAVLLPVLPNETFGPWNTLNPYEIWLMVVLISAISLAGYFAMRLAGAGKGIMITSAFGGIASSTATTLSLARMSQQLPMYRLLAGGILLASAIMYPRILLLVAVLNADLVQQLAIPLGGMSLTSFAMALWLWRRTEADGEFDSSQLNQKPFQIGPALKFGALLAVIMLAAEGIRAEMGEQGLWIVSLVAGLTDVDAITLTLTRMTDNGLGQQIAIVGITLAAISNTLVKGVLAGAAGDARLLKTLIPGLGLSMLAGGLLLLI